MGDTFPGGCDSPQTISRSLVDSALEGIHNFRAGQGTGQGVDLRGRSLDDGRGQFLCPLQRFAHGERQPCTTGLGRSRFDRDRWRKAASQGSPLLPESQAFPQIGT
ncbi:MAG: hypothetical protein KTU85_00020 [Acidimicrobiia bacterium]|nr:hypothetical protein [Acidimicrobiia bacterium]MCY4457566.1 hypothetical protein [Acidimicrobiaceae bacterium]